jgi:hypothetical protein
MKITASTLNTLEKRVAPPLIGRQFSSACLLNTKSSSVREPDRVRVRVRGWGLGFRVRVRVRVRFRG